MLHVKVIFAEPGDSAKWELIILFYRVQEHGAEPIIPFSCVLERNLADMSPDEAAKYCEENKVQR